MPDWKNVATELYNAIDAIPHDTYLNALQSYRKALEEEKKELQDKLGDPTLACTHPDGCACVLLHSYRNPPCSCAWSMPYPLYKAYLDR